jgi:hypothetical protein
MDKPATGPSSPWSDVNRQNSTGATVLQWKYTPSLLQGASQNEDVERKTSYDFWLHKMRSARTASLAARTSFMSLITDPVTNQLLQDPKSIKLAVALQHIRFPQCWQDPYTIPKVRSKFDDSEQYISNSHGTGSGYYVGNGLVATAGHVIDAMLEAKAENPRRDKVVVFGWTKGHIANQVLQLFSIKRFE